MLEILLHILLGLGHGDVDVLRQGVGGNAVHNAEVDGLCRPPQLRGHPVLGQPEHLGGGDGVDVHPGVEAADHGLIPRHMGQQPQLDLGVIRVHQHLAFRGHEHLAHLRP